MSDERAFDAAVLAVALECPRRAGPVDHADGLLLHGYTKYRPGHLACFMAEYFDEPGTIYRVGYWPSDAQAALNAAMAERAELQRIAEEARR